MNPLLSLTTLLGGVICCLEFICSSRFSEHQPGPVCLWLGAWWGRGDWKELIVFSSYEKEKDQLKSLGACVWAKVWVGTQELAPASDGGVGEGAQACGGEEWAGLGGGAGLAMVFGDSLAWPPLRSIRPRCRVV